MITQRISTFARQEWFLAVSALSCLAFFAFGDTLRNDFNRPFWLATIFIWLFAAVLGSALAVVRHAESLAELVGEPYGTLILTLSVTSIEVMSITAVMMHGDNNPTLARDTLFAVAMIILNGMVGLSLLLGAWRHREQQYNLQGANAYLGVIIPLAVFSLVMPNFTVSTQGPTLSISQQIFLVGISVGLYAAFLALQIHRHRGYFVLHDEIGRGPAHIARHAQRGGSLFHASLLIIYIAPVVFLAEQLALPVDYLIETLRAPAAVGGVIMAVLVATPEAIGAVRAALANQLQRSINIFLGSVLSTIGLTVPAIVLISNFTGQPIELGLQHTDLMMLLLTLTVSLVTFSNGRTNILQGVVHLVLFSAYLFLIVQN